MLIIENDVVYITRGDDGTLKVAVTSDDGSSYTMQPGDTLTLTVREAPTRDPPVIFTAIGAAGSERIPIRHEDTAEVEPGRYSADVQLRTEAGRRHTVWPELPAADRYKAKNFRNFIIMPEVTMT